MKTLLNYWFNSELDEDAHFFFHHHKTKSGYLSLDRKMYYTVYATLVNAYIDAVLDEISTQFRKGETITKNKTGAIENRLQKELTMFCKKVNREFNVNIKIPSSRRFRYLVNLYKKHGYIALLNGRIGNQHAKGKGVCQKEDKEMYNKAYELYFKHTPYIEIEQQTGVTASRIKHFAKYHKWHKLRTIAEQTP